MSQSITQDGVEGGAFFVNCSETSDTGHSKVPINIKDTPEED